MNKWALGLYGFRFPFLLTSCEPVWSPSEPGGGCSTSCTCLALPRSAHRAARTITHRCALHHIAGHMAFSFLVLAPIAMRESWESHRRTLEKQWRGVAYIGSFMALNIALNNISLLDISLTLNQIIRCVLSGGWWCGGVEGLGAWVVVACPRRRPRPRPL